MGHSMKNAVTIAICVYVGAVISLLLVSYAKSKGWI